MRSRGGPHNRTANSSGALSLIFGTTRRTVVVLVLAALGALLATFIGFSSTLFGPTSMGGEDDDDGRRDDDGAAMMGKRTVEGDNANNKAEGVKATHTTHRNTKDRGSPPLPLPTTPAFDTRYPHIQLAMCRQVPYPQLVGGGGGSSSATVVEVVVDVKGSDGGNQADRVAAAGVAGEDTDDNASISSNGKDAASSSINSIAYDLVAHHQPSDVMMVGCRGGNVGGGSGGFFLRGGSADGEEDIANDKSPIRRLAAYCNHITSTAADTDHLKPSLSPYYYAAARGGGRPPTVVGAPTTLPHFRVVMGIPTVDTSFSTDRRMRQRESWLRYGQNYDGWKYRKHFGGNSDTSGIVMKRRNTPATAESMFLVRYLLGRHHSQNFVFSDQLIDEAATFSDVLFLEMRDGKPTTAKTSGGGGFWGLEAEVGMGRKSLYWYVLAPRLYSFDFIMKGDDDVFLRIPQYLCDLEHKVVPFAAGLSGVDDAADGESHHGGNSRDGGTNSCPLLNKLVAASNASFYCNAGPLASIFGVSGRGEHERGGTSDADTADGCPALPRSMSVKNQGGIINYHRNSANDASATANDAVGAAKPPLPPTKGIYWGKVMQWKAAKGDSSSEFLFVGGMSITMSRDVAAMVTADLGLYRPSVPFVFIKEGITNEAAAMAYDTANALIASPSNTKVSSEEGGASAKTTITISHTASSSSLRPASNNNPHDLSPSVVPNPLGYGGIGDYFSAAVRHAYLYHAVGGSVGTDASAKPFYKARNHDHEDVMIGRTLYTIARRRKGMLVGGGGEGKGQKDALLSAMTATSSMALEFLGRAANNTDGVVSPKVAHRLRQLSQEGGGSHKSPPPPPTSHSIRHMLGIVIVDDCRYHDVHTGENKKPLTDKSLVIHHLKNEEYNVLFKRFGDGAGKRRNDGGNDDVDAIHQREQPTCQCRDTAASDGYRRGHPVLRLC